MGTALNVTPAGNNLYQVEVEEETADETRDTIVEVAIPDGFLEDLALGEDASPQDVVLEAVRFVLDRTDQPDELEPRLSLDDVAERYPGFTESLGRALGGDKGDTLHRQYTADRELTDSDQRLIDETREAQESGQASRETERY